MCPLDLVAPVNAIRYCGASCLMDAHPETWQMDTEKVARFLEEECVMKDGGCYNNDSPIRALFVHILGSACGWIVWSIGHGTASMSWKTPARDGVLQVPVCWNIRRRRGFQFQWKQDCHAGGGGSWSPATRIRRPCPLPHDAGQGRRDGIRYNEIGYNYRLTNLQAAVGLAQMEQLTLS